ncbi:unnamed protein product [Amoebophrya sp. A120]|nr:unnamed protein product [Amoebophrya sp. A120]|eukprot:GSA120T00004002001.1
MRRLRTVPLLLLAAEPLKVLVQSRTVPKPPRRADGDAAPTTTVRQLKGLMQRLHSVDPHAFDLLGDAVAADKQQLNLAKNGLQQPNGATTISLARLEKMSASTSSSDVVKQLSSVLASMKRKSPKEFGQVLNLVKEVKSSDKKKDQNTQHLSSAFLQLSATAAKLKTELQTAIFSRGKAMQMKQLIHDVRKLDPAVVAKDEAKLSGLVSKLHGMDPKTADMVQALLSAVMSSSAKARSLKKGAAAGAGKVSLLQLDQKMQLNLKNVVDPVSQEERLLKIRPLLMKLARLDSKTFGHLATVATFAQNAADEKLMAGDATANGNALGAAKNSQPTMPLV